MALALADLERVLGGAVLESAAGRDMPVFTIAAGHLVEVASRLKQDLSFDMLVDITAVDWLPRVPRFDLVWHFYATTHFGRVRIKARVTEQEPAVDSLVGLYGSAGFMERECRDMYGIVFRGNPDQRPILLYEGFTGHPLRKDYPKEREQPLVRYRS